MPHAPEQLFVVAHTHWDREWYHTAERFRQRLVVLVDELLDAPPVAGTSFLLDGQAVLLEDYLAVRPDRAGELAALLRDGRLEAGPWYVLADELIPGGEALVRNLLAGGETVRRLRGEAPPVLYCPDSFGHPAILPELATGFGCTLVILWRGYGGARWPDGDTMRWRGPTGAEVLAHHLPPEGYEFGSALPADAADARDRWRRIAGVLLPRATTGVALLLNGADHHARQHALREAVESLDSAAGPVPVGAATLRSAAARLVDAASRTTVPLVSGELRDSYGYAWTLGGTLGTRAGQKRRNAGAERMLVRDVEPWVALAGSPAQDALLHAAWRELLRGHPHDTLCGTSIDAVADALDQRLAAVESQVDGLREDALARVIRHDTEAARRDPAAWRPVLVLRNRAPRVRSGVAEVVVATKLADVAVGPGSASRQGSVAEPGGDVGARGLQVLSHARRVALTEAPRAYPKAELVEELRALAWVDDLGGYTVRTHTLDALAFGGPPDPVQVETDTISNGALRVEVGADGGVRLEDLASGRVMEGAVSIELARDVGDLYTPAIRERLDGPVFDGCEVVHRGPLRGEVAMRFVDAEHGWMVLRLQLDAGLPALRIRVEGENRRTDARLRVVFGSDGAEAERGRPDPVRGGPPTGNLAERTDERRIERVRPASVDRTLADAAFHPVERHAIDVSAEDARVERAVPTAPLHRWVSRFGEAGGCTVISDGLAEYESLDDGRVAITLWRAVGELSRADLPERPGHAGWPASTPAAQAQGSYAAQFALALHGPDTDAQRDDIEHLADDVLLPLTGETLRSNLLPPLVGGGIALEGAGLAFSAAMPAREAGCVVLRCVNRRGAMVRGRWRLGRSIAEAWRARLDESPVAGLEAAESSVEFDAPPMAIVTIVVRLVSDGGPGV